MNVSRDIPTLLIECDNIIRKSNNQLNILVSKCERLQKSMEELLLDSAARIACGSKLEHEKFLDALREKIHHCLTDVNMCVKISSNASDLSKNMSREPTVLDRAIEHSRYVYVDPARQVALFNLRVDALKHFSSQHFSKIESQ